MSILTNKKNITKQRTTLLVHSTPKNVKVVFIGNGGCGKTTFLSKVRHNIFESKYNPTMGVDIVNITKKMWTESDNISNNYFSLNCWDCAGQEKYSGLKEKYYANAHTVVICFRVDSEIEVSSIPVWLKQVCPSINVILMGTNNESTHIKGLISHLETYKLPFCFVSTKTGDNLSRPFEMIYNTFF